MIEIKEIKDIIARTIWESTGEDGRKIAHELIIGRPFQLPDDENGDWVCPISIQNFTSRIVPAYGTDSVGALMNAMILAKALFDKIHDKENQQQGEQNFGAIHNHP